MQVSHVFLSLDILLSSLSFVACMQFAIIFLFKFSDDEMTAAK